MLLLVLGVFSCSSNAGLEVRPWSTSCDVLTAACEYAAVEAVADGLALGRDCGCNTIDNAVSPELDYRQLDELCADVKLFVPDDATCLEDVEEAAAYCYYVTLFPACEAAAGGAGC